MKKEKFRIGFLLFIIVFLISANNISKAYNEVQISNETDYSVEYKKWLELPDEEKENTIMPYMYSIKLEEKNNSSTINLYNLEATENNNTIPTRYNTADYVDIKVRDQGISNSCWTITASELFEIAYAKLQNNNQIIPFSQRHMEYSCSRYFANNVENQNTFNRTVGSGGNFEYAMAYYTSGRGPILEKDMPFEDNRDIIEISQIQNKTVQAQLEAYTKYPQIHKIYDENNNVAYMDDSNYTEYSKEQIDEFRNNIKQQIMQYGAVGAYTYWKSSDSFFSEDFNAYFCNSPSATRNHAICIVGWDDTYSKNNFKEGCKPANDGAYIVLNSWGTEWNSGKGYYYISYDDYFVEYGMYGIQGLSSIDYDNIYQYDELGISSSLYSNYEPTNIYGANVFKRENNSREKLTEIGLYIYNTTNATIYLNKNGNTLNTENLEIIATADSLTPGYHIIKLDNPILVGKTFSIVVKYSNDIQARLPLETKLNNENSKYTTAVSNSGESYYSANGINFKDLYEFNSDSFTNANVCIKAFTLDETKKANSEQYILNENWKIIKDAEENILFGIEENTTIEELLSSSNFSSNYIVKAYKGNNEITTGKVTTGTIIKIYQGSNLIKEYTVVIYGDTTGDGGINSVDALSIVKNKLGVAPFKNAVYEEAGKVTSKTRTLDLIPSAVDALTVIKNKLELEKISQY